MWSLRCVCPLVAILLVVIVSHALEDEPPSYEFFDLVPDSSYKLHDGYHNWTTGLETCLREGAYLVVINSLEKAFVVKNLFKRVPRRDFPDYLHVGFSDISGKGSWETIFGVPLSESGYYNLSPYQPNITGSDDGHCGGLDRNAEFLAVLCGWELPFICEKPSWKE